ncbi:uncharacterized protein [Porites lutea]|uniref:uncharacterized protein n=1 Tax=Porites lutea TaxID=51062 RepID=UPI003CC6869F
MIDGILQLYEELKMKDLRKRYKKEDLMFRERLWEIRYTEMEPSVKKKFLNEMRELASSIGERERVKVYLAALKDLREKEQPSTSLTPKVLQVQMSSLLEKSSSDAGEEEEEEEEEEVAVEAEEDVEAVTAEASGTESSAEVISVGSEEDIVTLSEQEVEGGS